MAKEKPWNSTLLPNLECPVLQTNSIPCRKHKFLWQQKGEVHWRSSFEKKTFPLLIGITWISATPSLFSVVKLCFGWMVCEVVLSFELRTEVTVLVTCSKPKANTEKIYERVNLKRADVTTMIPMQEAHPAMFPERTLWKEKGKKWWNLIAKKCIGTACISDTQDTFLLSFLVPSWKWTLSFWWMILWVVKAGFQLARENTTKLSINSTKIMKINTTTEHMLLVRAWDVSSSEEHREESDKLFGRFKFFPQWWMIHFTHDYKAGQIPWNILWINSTSRKHGSLLHRRLKHWIEMCAFAFPFHKKVKISLFPANGNAIASNENGHVPQVSMSFLSETPRQYLPSILNPQERIQAQSWSKERKKINLDRQELEEKFCCIKNSRLSGGRNLAAPRTWLHALGTAMKTFLKGSAAKMKTTPNQAFRWCLHNFLVISNLVGQVHHGTHPKKLMWLFFPTRRFDWSHHPGKETAQTSRADDEREIREALGGSSSSQNCFPWCPQKGVFSVGLWRPGQTSFPHYCIIVPVDNFHDFREQIFALLQKHALWFQWFLLFFMETSTAFFWFCSSRVTSFPHLLTDFPTVFILIHLVFLSLLSEWFNLWRLLHSSCALCKNVGTIGIVHSWVRTFTNENFLFFYWSQNLQKRPKETATWHRWCVGTWVVINVIDTQWICCVACVPSWKLGCLQRGKLHLWIYTLYKAKTKFQKKLFISLAITRVRPAAPAPTDVAAPDLHNMGRFCGDPKLICALFMEMETKEQRIAQPAQLQEKTNWFSEVKAGGILYGRNRFCCWNIEHGPLLVTPPSRNTSRRQFYWRPVRRIQTQSPSAGSLSCEVWLQRNIAHKVEHKAKSVTNKLISNRSRMEKWKLFFERIFIPERAGFASVFWSTKEQSYPQKKKNKIRDWMPDCFWGTDL